MCFFVTLHINNDLSEFKANHYSQLEIFTRRVLVQHWYCCKCGWTLKLGLFASLYFGSGRRVSIWFFVVNFNFIFSFGQQFRAGRNKISHLQQYLPVRRKNEFQPAVLLNYANIIHHLADRGTYL